MELNRQSVPAGPKNLHSNQTDRGRAAARSVKHDYHGRRLRAQLGRLRSTSALAVLVVVDR